MFAIPSDVLVAAVVGMVIATLWRWLRGDAGLGKLQTREQLLENEVVKLRSQLDQVINQNLGFATQVLKLERALEAANDEIRHLKSLMGQQMQAAFRWEQNQELRRGLRVLSANEVLRVLEEFPEMVFPASVDTPERARQLLEWVDRHDAGARLKEAILKVNPGAFRA